MRCSTSAGLRPEPRARRVMRAGSLKILMLLLSSSLSVMDSMMVMKRLITIWLALSLPLGSRSVLNPGSIDIIWLMGPSSSTDSNMSRSTRIVTLPLEMVSSSSGCLSSGMTSWILSISPPTSPLPSSRCTNRFVSNDSNWSMCSPVPRKMMGDLVAATADSAPPPLAWPSILVMITPPTSTLSLNALAWSNAAWPMEPSMTKMTRSGLTAAATCLISSNSAASCLCLPDVSTMMRSRFSSRKRSTPCCAMTAGSVSL
mmetsp:Transcript_6739/g.16779  ORF Transcript_6739/g.16779 Transcript_6739/m.16779 type:complete len:258 (-) Transcript_6739:700-1473(-)